MNKKLQQLALLWKLTPSTVHLLIWLLRRGKKNEICEIEVDLNKYDLFVEKKRGKAYDRKTLNKAFSF